MLLHVILYSIFLIILLLLTRMTWQFRFIERENARQANAGEPIVADLGLSQGFIYAALVLDIILIVFYTWFLVRGTPWEGHLMEWLNIVVRLMHVTFGIAWIGASFYFVFLENALNRTKDLRPELAGNLWAVHGGGFYYLEKYKVAPETIPSNLHWFKYEAYFTWLSGFSLLFVVYYFNARSMLIDPNVWPANPLVASAAGISSFIAAWPLYDRLCRSPLLKTGYWFTALGFLLAVGFAYGYAVMFSSRAAYIHFGAMLGTLMAGNVFFVIIPAQKAMVKAATAKQPLDASLGIHAGLRSLHNNYFTLPVIFVMISNHFPSTFGSPYSWAVLGAITLGTAGVKHYLNLREKGQHTVWIMPASVLILLATAFITSPAKPGNCTEQVSIATVNRIVQARCTSCHASRPTDDVYTAPPNGVSYDTPENIARLKDKIMQRVVVTQTMPLNNKTNMTPEERELLRCWIEQGGKLK